jgi:hypothetical protein
MVRYWPEGRTVMPDGKSDDRFLQKLTEELEDGIGIGHATIQIEAGPAEACRLAPDKPSGNKLRSRS